MPGPDALASAYQREKHRVHTTPPDSSTTHPVLSVLDCSDDGYFRGVVQEAFQYGAVRYTKRGVELLHCPSTGSTFATFYHGEQQAGRQDTVVIVKADDPERFHVNVRNSSTYSRATCDKCGEPLI